MPRDGFFFSIQILQNQYWLGLCPDPAGGAYNALTDQLVCWGGGYHYLLPRRLWHLAFNASVLTGLWP